MSMTPGRSWGSRVTSSMTNRLSNPQCAVLKQSNQKQLSGQGQGYGLSSTQTSLNVSPVKDLLGTHIQEQRCSFGPSTVKLQQDGKIVSVLSGGKCGLKIMKYHTLHVSSATSFRLQGQNWKALDKEMQYTGGTSALPLPSPPSGLL